MNILVQQQLRELAQKQEKKEWKAIPQENSMMNGQRMWSVVGPACVGCFEEWGFDESSARYIAAADPATVLALLDELDTANANHENAVAHMQSVCAERELLKAENAELIGLMRRVVAEHPRRSHKNDGNGPGHGHAIPGIWDEDNGELAGKPCAWCSIWNAAKGIVERHEQAMTKEQQA